MSTEDEDKQLETFFILLEDQVGDVLSRSIFSVGAMVSAVRGRSKNTFNALKGSLFKLVPDENDNHNYYINLVSVDNPRNFLQKCDLNCVRKLSKQEYDILLAVPTTHQRCDVIHVRADGKTQLKDACNAKTGDSVEVENDNEKGGEAKQGVLTYIGLMNDDKTKKGVYFGVRLLKGPVSDSDNYLEKTVFVPVNVINFLVEDTSGCNRTEKQNDKDLADKSNQWQNKTNEKYGENEDKSMNKFKGKQTGHTQKRKSKTKQREGIDLPVGTRVVCFLSDHSKPVAGTIRFFDNIGSDGIMAGLELDTKHEKSNLVHYRNIKKYFDCEPGKVLIVKPDTLMKEEEYTCTNNNEKKTYVTVNDGSSKKLEKKEVKPSEVKSIDPYKEQMELFKKLEEKKHSSLNLGHTQKYSTQNYEGREENIEREIWSHDQGIQGIINDFDTKLPSNEFVPSQQGSLINVGTPSNNYSEVVNMTLTKQNKGEKKEDRYISNTSADRIRKEYPTQQSSLQIGSMVEITIQHKKYYGVLKWRGIHERYPDTIFAGIELENNELTACTDGTFIGRKYFHSPLHRAFFIKLHLCKPDSRFALQDTMETQKQITTNINTSIKGSIMPITKLDMGYLGRDKGIQGNYNSCYMDSILFAMFGYSHVFDVMLNRKKRFDDIKEYDNVQMILKEQIVNPLRKNGFVGHPSILELRKCLNELGDIGGFMTEEKDPEEFIVLLFEKVLKVDPFIKLRVNNRDEVSHLYQIFFPKEERNPLPSVQYLLEYSFLSSNLKLAEIPSVMILQMPRFGQQKLYKRIQITSTLDITPLLADEIHACVICGHSAICHCPDCACLFGWEVVHTYLCQSCWDSVHTHPKRYNHKPVTSVVKSLNSTQIDTSDPVMLELFAVVCIEKSHYVSFVKCGSDENEKWLFFDSMADRVGGEVGHNIPEVTLLDNLKNFLNGNPLEISELDKKTNEQVMRVFDDASLCFYCNKNLTMYR